MDPLRTRVAALRSWQNPDGGWGYFPGKQSWLEPTAWAAIALHDFEKDASARAWKLVKSWQQADGSCRPCANVPVPNWTAALAVTLGVLQGDSDAVKKGADYLLGNTGADSSTMSRIAKFISPDHTDREPKFQGWPWKPGNTSWIEPTAHSITALRMARLGAERVTSAQNMILHMRCKDGGWNYGARIALGTPLNSFPETTALALIGLAGRTDVADAVQKAQTLLAEKQSPLSKAWLQVALRLHGRQPAIELGAPDPQDVLLTAIEAFGESEGNWKLVVKA